MTKARPAKVKKPPAYSYTYDPKTGRYSMDAASLTAWLMDVEGRAKLERALDSACNFIEGLGDAVACEKAAKLRESVK